MGDRLMAQPNVAALVEQLQLALGVMVPCGSITLNLNDGRLQNVETKTYTRIVPDRQDRNRLDKSGSGRA